MKKAICLLFILMFCLIAAYLPANVFAFTYQTDKHTQHLSEPAAVAADSSRVIVAETYGDKKQLHVFSDNAPYLATADNAFDGEIVKMRVAGQFLYIQQTESFVVFNLSAMQTEFVLNEKIIAFDTNGTVICFAFEKSINASVTETFLNIIDLTALNASTKIADEFVAHSLSLGIALNDLAVSDTEINLLFSISGQPQETFVRRWLSLTNPSKKSRTDAEASSDSYVLCAGSDFWLYTETHLNGDNTLTVDGVSYVSHDEIYLLSRADSRVHQYKLTDDGFKRTGVTFGTNSRGDAIPYNPQTLLGGKNDFRLARINSSDAYLYTPDALDEAYSHLGNWGYYVDDGQPAFVFGEAVSGYYYIWHNGKFSFVAEKYVDFDDNQNPQLTSDYAASTVKIPSTANQKLYYLPQNENSQIAVNNIPVDADITLITKLTGFDGGKWSLISFEHSGSTVFGFMLNAALIDKPTPVPTFEIYRANPPAMSSMSVFATPDDSSEVITKISSGGEVKVYEKGETWSKIKVTVNGVTVEGFVRTNELITHGLTNTLAAGFVLGIGLLIIIAMLMFFNKRRKSLNRKAKADSSVFTDLDKLD